MVCATGTLPVGLGQLTSGLALGSGPAYCACCGGVHPTATAMNGSDNAINRMGWIRLVGIFLSLFAAVEPWLGGSGAGPGRGRRSRSSGNAARDAADHAL